jgi:UDP-2,3-diacylglucosamine pyrophosphatase LpxH
MIDRNRLRLAMPYATPKQRAVIEEYLSHEEGPGSKTANALSVNPSSVTRALHGALARLDRQQHKSPRGFEAVKVSTNGKGDVTAVKHRPIPDEDLPPPPDHVVRGVSTLYDASGEVSARWVKTQRTAEQQWQGFVEATERHVEQYRGAAGVSVGPKATPMPSVRAYYVLGDMHVGLLSWAKETGRNMDLKTIVSLGIEATSSLVVRTMAAEEAVLVNVGDFFHADDNTNRTPNGKNVLDVDSRYGKVAEAGFSLMRDMITLLRQKHRTVRVVNARGNHDPHLAIALYAFLKALYSQDPNVIIEEPYRPLQTFMYGKNLVGVTHGDGMKMTKIPEVLATQCRKDWSKAEYCWVATGHIHHKQKLEQGGVVVESFNTLNTADHWHAAHGFVGSGRWFESVTLAEAGGECARARATVNSKGQVI